MKGGNRVMKKERLMNIEKIVKKILEENELARKDDCFLILKVVLTIFPYDSVKTFTEVMSGAKNKGISFESITRARRKVQKNYPELKDKETTEIRNEEQKEYIDYSRERQE